jgi:hypothetical protein
MLRLTEGVLAGAMPARPRTKVDARSRTNSLSLSSSSPLTAPARAAAMARRRAICWRKYSAMCGVGAGQAFAREPDLFRGIADFLALA